MGVPQLLPQLKDITETVSLEEFRGKTLAIDAYSWLHKSVMSCPVELGRGLYTDKYVNYFRKRIRMLRNFGAEPYFVFDGDKFASKTSIENGREKLRQENRELALKCAEQGDNKTAWKHFLLCVDVTPQMAKSVIEMLKLEGIKFIVAPYEADAQMVFLEKVGLADGILSEDSDLLVFGAQCLLTKLTDTGFCCRIRQSNFKNCKIAPLGLLSSAQLRMVACLAGCDYTSGVPNVGIVKAFKLVKRMGTMKKCLMSLKLEGKISVPADFEEQYEKADISFQFQRVFDPRTDKMTTLNEITGAFTDHVHLQECIGPLHDIEIHRKIAHAELDPMTKDKLNTREVSLSLLRAENAGKSVGSKPATRSLTTPAPKVTAKVRSIDTFFKLSQPSTGKDSVRESSVTKRRRLFQPVGVQGTNSKFFAARGGLKAETPQTKEPVQKEEPWDNGLKDATLVAKKDSPAKKSSPSVDGSSFLQGLQSSDFDLTDPDDNDMGHDLEETPTKPSLVGASVIPSIQSSPVSEPTAEVKRGLFDKFGFRQPAKTSIQQQQQNANRPLKRIPLSSKPFSGNVTTIKTKQGMSRNLTLDSFIYRA